MSSTSVLKAGNFVRFEFPNTTNVSEGIVFCHDNNICILNIDDGKYTMIPSIDEAKITLLREVEHADEDTSSSSPFKFPKVISSKLQTREENAILQRQKEAKHINPYTSLKGQLIYDQYVKTLPCKWDQNDIVILNSVKIAPPYTINNCLAMNENDTPDPQVVNRIKDMLVNITEQVDEILVDADTE